MNSKLSIVTVCFNSEKTISKTIESVLEQKYEDYEYLIVDGGSTDNTKDIIESYIPAFNGKLRYISEKDKGWYDAMNKGIRNTTGDFICFINSDDYFDENVFDYIGRYIDKHKVHNDSIVYGDSTNVYMNSRGEVLYRLIKAPPDINVSNPNLKDGMCGIRHQSMFTGRKVFDFVGELNLTYRLHADWDFMIKTLKANVDYVYVDKNLSFYSMYGASTKATYGERHRVRKDNELYSTFDWTYLKDRFGIKTFAKLVLGDKNWNDMLFYFHKKGI